MKHDSELKLQAYLDGELSPRERQRVADWVATDREMQLLLEELQNTTSAIRGNELDIQVPETREFYWSKIEQQIRREAQKPAPAATPFFWLGWRRYLAPLAGAAGAVALLMVSVKQVSPGIVDEITTSSDVEAMTFVDQTAGMTVVWLETHEGFDAESEIGSDVDIE